MRLLHEAVSDANARFTIFVDATFLLRIKQLSECHSELKKQYDLLAEHISSLKSLGHDIQLHIHPHWMYSSYSNGEWQIDHDHYKLNDLDSQLAIDLTNQSKALLDEIVGEKTVAFRAGGFSAQPTNLLTSVFSSVGLMADSSVCPGSSYSSAQQRYNYTSAPIMRDVYHFETDICSEEPSGHFWEFPISMFNVSPFFHWKLVINRVAKRPNHRIFGDGVAVPTASDSIIKRLTQWQNCQTTIDGYKINFLLSSYQKWRKENRQLLTILGHPKLATPYSVRKLHDFTRLAVKNGDSFTTIKQMINA